MRWVAKAALQRGLGLVPQGERLNYLFQRHVAHSLPAGESVFRRKFARAEQHVAAYQEHGSGTPLAGQQGPFSLGAQGVLEEAFRKASFHAVESRVVRAPLRMQSADECVRFEQQSFGALHQMLSGLDAGEREGAWQEIASRLRQFESGGRFEGPCELVIGVGTAP